MRGRSATLLNCSIGPPIFLFLLRKKREGIFEEKYSKELFPLKKNFK
jgi:hypothetical protein